MMKYIIHGLAADAVLKLQFGVSPPVAEVKPKVFHLSIVQQPGMRHQSSLAVPVDGIICSSSREEMDRVDASSIVASVKDAESIRKMPVVNKIGNAVGATMTGWFTGRYRSVAFFVNRASPVPASIILWPVYILPKFIDLLGGQWLKLSWSRIWHGRSITHYQLSEVY